MLWDISNFCLRANAYIALFKYIDGDPKEFADGDSVTHALLPMARAGNHSACEALLSWKKNQSIMTWTFKEYELEKVDRWLYRDTSEDIVITDEMVEDAIRDRANGGIE